MEFVKRWIRRKFPTALVAFHEFRSARQYIGRKPVMTPHGFLFMGHPGMERGTFEPVESRFILKQTRTAPVLVDVGANTGYFACLARSKGQHVIAVEPLVANVDLMLRNLMANGFDDVEVFPVGLSESSGIADLYGGGTGASLLAEWSGTSSVWRRPVPVSTLDTLLSGRFEGEQLTVKIDVEGAERDVLAGANETLAREPAPEWLIEVNLTEHHPLGLNPHFREVFEVFWAHGYQGSTAEIPSRIVREDDVDRWIARRQRDFGNINFIFSRSSSPNEET